ncbi:tetratricopeptide repeat protein [Hymenobacter psoromatis]|uniref:tetratricopeptide repeat protein n=1 Tax=Hymenobacter psoromatis TaxID=1484116 RepID=UPI001CBF99A3|nr:tetratricopeptide repeat protein [Hymenobacter psoromatis]
MKVSLVAALLILLGASLPGWDWLVRVREHNAAQVQAAAAARHGQATEAALLFGRAGRLAGRGGPTPALLLNLAQAQAQAGQLAAARVTYGRLLAPSMPATVGTAARQQLAGLLAAQRQYSQAISLLRQALRLDPANAAARYNYELLSQYLAGQRPPALPPPSNSDPKSKPKDSSAKRDSTAKASGGERSPSASPTTGAGRPGEIADPAPPPPGGRAGAPQPGRAGQPDRQRPTPAPGTNAPGSGPGGSGPTRPVPTGVAGGSQRGLDVTGAGNAPGRSHRPGTDAATDTDLQLQTQRERLKAMDLTPAQAQQLLNTLRESEQQYLQQRPRPRQGNAPAPGQPTW